MVQPTRRELMALGAAFPLVAAPATATAQGQMPVRAIPSTGETLPVIGLGSSKGVDEIASRGEDSMRQVLRALVSAGGRLVDTWPRRSENDARFGKVINEPDLRTRLFVTSKIDRVGREAGIAQFRETQRNYGRKVIDLVQIFSLTDLESHWPTLRALKDAGEARYIGVTVSQDDLHGELEAFLRRERPDFVQMNYSISERRVEDRLLPFAADRGVAVVINRPFMNGALFRQLESRPLPPWAAEIGCTTWAQFSLKYILGNPMLTAVLTETTNPRHMVENANAALGRYPDADMRRRMRDFIATA